jgi:hypothetical protein
MSGGDLFGALQDDLVQHVLSFLPSRDAVKTAVLARRWRYLWRSTLAVRVNGSGDGFRLFVNSLLLYRDGASPLRSFEIDADLLIGEESDGEYSAYDPREVDPHVDLWISTPCQRAVRAPSSPVSRTKRSCGLPGRSYLSPPRT